MDKELTKKREAVQHKIFVSMLHILWIFGLPAIGAYFAGAWLDQSTYFTRPYGSILAGAVALTLSWIAVIHLYRRLVAEYRALDEAEEAYEKHVSEQKKTTIHTTADSADTDSDTDL